MTGTPPESGRPIECKRYICYTDGDGSFEFDPWKNSLNADRHGVSLLWARRLWKVTHVIIPAKCVVGEKRFMIIGKIDEKCHAAVFTKRGEVIRLISCHRADGRLERIYEDQIRNE